jgi:hypothetical protein
MRKIYTTCCSVTLAVLLPATGAAQNFTTTATDCSDLQLYAAQGLPNGATHKYLFRGTCREVEKDDGKVAKIRWEAWVEVESRYDVATAELIEAVSVKMSGHSDGPASGTMQLKLKCAQDPMITMSKCSVMQSNAKATWPDFVQAWLRDAPFTRGKVSLNQAIALSQQSDAKNPPPPPPPPAAGKGPQQIPSVVGAVANVELVLESGLTIPLQSGRSVAAKPLGRELRWTIVGAEGEVLRTFPAGSRAFRTPKKEILVNWGGGTFNAGIERSERRLAIPKRSS